MCLAALFTITFLPSVYYYIIPCLLLGLSVSLCV